MEKFKSIEVQFYEWIGIKQFRKLALFYEFIRHRENGQKNVNYHLRSTSARSAESFLPYLFYNAAVHVFGLMVVALYFEVKLFYSFGSAWLDFVLMLSAVLNLYCIILQRYTYLRICALRSRSLDLSCQRWNRDKYLFWSRFPTNYTAEQAQSDLDLLLRLQKAGMEDSLCFLNKEDAPGLLRMAEIMGTPTEQRKDLCAARKTVNSSGRSLRQTVFDIGNIASPYQRIDWRINRFQRLLQIRPRSPFLSVGAVITLDSEAEGAWHTLVPSNGREELLKKTALLCAVFREKIEAGVI